MLKDKKFMSVLRRDAIFVGRALIAVVFIAFAGLAVGAAVLDLIAIVE